MKRKVTKRGITLRFWAGLTLLVWAGAGLAQQIETPGGALPVRQVMAGLDQPWSLDFLPGGDLLVTERGGRLLRVSAGVARPVAGVAPVWAVGQGGLLDVRVARDFATSRRVFLSYAKPQGEGGSTAVAVAVLRGNRLEGWRDLWVQPGPTTSGVHFGGRLALDGNGDLLLTTGDRGEGMPAQADEGARGRVLRIAADGGWVEEVSRGHRNPQGLAIDAAGRLWASEHGARGGDEINLIRRGVNYGWPVIAYGVNYDGSKIGEGHAKPGLAQPEFYWDPSIAPSGHMIHSGTGAPGWDGDHFIGSLKFDEIHRLDPEGWEEEVWKSPETIRVRDIREGPEGGVWFLSVGRGTLYRIAPPGG